MNKKILFTAAGTHDPVTMVDKEINKCEDGSILSICRNIKPDKVYLYLSKELNELEKNDSRFCEAIKKISPDIEVQLIVSEDSCNVAKFDYYINKFKKELIEIKKEMQDDDELYVNVSSGTPQMKSTLLLLGVWGVFNVKCCQVTTPKESSNFDTSKMIVWTDNLENISAKVDYKNRFEILNVIEDSAIPNLQCTNIEQNIIKLIQRYDYAGALEFVSEIESINKNRTNKYRRLIEIADKREKLDYINAKKLVNEKWRDEKLKEEVEKTFLNNNNANMIKCFEYILNLEIKLKKEEFSDFYRGINPILYNMYLSLFEKIFGSIDKYSIKEREELHWDKSKLLNGDKIVYNYLIEGFKEENKEFEPEKGFIDSNTLYIPIIKSMCMEKKSIIEYMKNLERMRKRRNGIAHDFVKKAINDDTIENILDGIYSFKNVSKKTLRSIEWMKKIFIETFGAIDENCWSAFDMMNDIIIKRITENT